MKLRKLISMKNETQSKTLRELTEDEACKVSGGGEIYERINSLDFDHPGPISPNSSRVKVKQIPSLLCPSSYS